MAEIDLLRFFKTGQFGAITLGSSRQSVQQLLGEPDNFSTPHLDALNARASAPVWEYGGIELHFGGSHNQSVTLIAFTPFHLSGPEQWKTVIVAWIFGSYFGPTLRELERALVSAFIPYRMCKRKSMYSTLKGPAQQESEGVLCLNSGIEVHFGNDGTILRVEMGKAVVEETAVITTHKTPHIVYEADYSQYVFSAE
jgi:hypothetical protein